MPETVKIGAKLIDVTVEENLKMRGEPRLGWADWPGSEIAVEARQSSHEMVNTIIHEVLHLFCRRSALEDLPEVRKHEEFIVNLMANVFCEMVKENPALMKWMVNTLARPDTGRDRMRKYGKEREGDGDEREAE